jgi:hypothetical protein
MSRRLKSKIAHYLFLRQHKDQRQNRQAVSLREAGTIGILYDATHERNYEVIRKLVKDIRALHKEVLALGYYNRRALPQNRFAKLGLDFFTRKSVGWTLKPSNQVVTNFINTEFDILINLNIEKCFPLKYISAKTQARFKIGRWDRRNAPICDLMIHTEEGLSLGQFVEQVMHYLNLINNDRLQEA